MQRTIRVRVPASVSGDPHVAFYLKPGREFVGRLAEGTDGLGFRIRGQGARPGGIFCLFKGCAHLHGRDWEIVEDAAIARKATQP